MPPYLSPPNGSHMLKLVPSVFPLKSHFTGTNFYLGSSHFGSNSHWNIRTGKSQFEEVFRGREREKRQSERKNEDYRGFTVIF